MPDFIEELTFPAPLEIFFKLHRPIEVILNGAFPAAGNDDDIFNP